MSLVSLVRKWNKNRKWKRRADKTEERKKRLLSFGVNSVGVLARCKHGMFVVNPEDSFVSKSLLDSGEYAENEIVLAKKFIPQGGRVLIVGAHIGALAVPLASYCSGSVIVEANPRSFELLRINLLINGCQNFDVFNNAADEKSGFLDFLVCKDNSGGSKRVPLKRSNYYYDSPEIVSIPSVRVDDLVDDKVFDLIIMDIEGSEYFALKGMPSILESSNALAVEFIPHHLENVAGVTCQQFVSLLLPTFKYMYIPKEDRLVGREDIPATLSGFVDSGQSHDVLVFMKTVPSQISAGVGLGG